MNKHFDFWNHGIHPITGFFIGDDRIVEYNYNKYIIDTLILPRNKYNMKIQSIIYLLKYKLHERNIYIPRKK